jgi:hypothetical protein
MPGKEAQQPPIVTPKENPALNEWEGVADPDFKDFLTAVEGGLVLASKEGFYQLAASLYPVANHLDPTPRSVTSSVVGSYVARLYALERQQVIFTVQNLESNGRRKVTDKNGMLISLSYLYVWKKLLPEDSRTVKDRAPMLLDEASRLWGENPLSDILREESERLSRNEKKDPALVPDFAFTPPPGLSTPSDGSKDPTIITPNDDDTEHNELEESRAEEQMRSSGIDEVKKFRESLKKEANRVGSLPFLTEEVQWLRIGMLEATGKKVNYIREASLILQGRSNEFVRKRLNDAITGAELDKGLALAEYYIEKHDSRNLLNTYKRLKDLVAKYGSRIDLKK